MKKQNFLYPLVQFEKNTWEIDEFDCSSMFLLIGTEKALLIDCGIGIGDLRGAIESITDKPLIVVLSHGHLDHTGNARQFDEIWMPRADQNVQIPHKLETRKEFVREIAERQKGSLGFPFTMFHLYPYDLDTDLREPGPDEPMPVIHDLNDGQQFDLGGGRIVTAYACPGHTPGEMIFLDHQTRTLFAADALNYNLYLGKVPLELSLSYYRRMYDMAGQYDRIYNGHHDFRAFGAPLGDDCLPTVIEMMEDVLAGRIAPFSSGGQEECVQIRKNRNFIKYYPSYIYNLK